MNADLLIQALLEAVEVGDDGVSLTHMRLPVETKWVPGCKPGQFKTLHRFIIRHPVHGAIGRLAGYHDAGDDSFTIDSIDLTSHPRYVNQQSRPRQPGSGNEGELDSYEGVSRTLIRSGLRSLMKKIPGLKKIVGKSRTTGTHAIAAEGDPNKEKANTEVNLPKSMRQAV